MEKEFLTQTFRSVTLNVTAGRIDSFREQDETSGTVRVYDGDCIGVAGSLGQCDEAALTAKAEDALALKIPYPCDLGEALVREELREEEIIPVPELIPTMQAFLDRLGEACPRFAFSNKISLNYEKRTYRNSRGRRLASSGRSISIELIAQSRGSGNLMDAVFGYCGSHFDPEALLGQFKAQYDAFYRPADLAPGRYPVVWEAPGLFESFLPHFSGEMYASGASLLSGKLGQPAFSEKLTLRDDRNPETNPGCCFFDAEGCVAPGLRPTLAEKGVLTGVLTTKKSARRFGLPNLGTAQADYDGVPAPGFRRFYLEPTADRLAALVPGKAIFVGYVSGGDTTPDGHFATPVQLAYLMEDGKLAGRLSELNVGGNFYELLSRDYLGAVQGDPMEDSVTCAVIMDVDKA
mgnify:CR=1 FL=1